MRKKYPKNHLLWPVWDLQRQILKRGGKIDRHSDLLAYFEGRSLEPNTNPVEFLYQLSLKSNKNKEISKLIHLEKMVYKQTTEKYSIEPFKKKKSSNTPMFKGYGYKIPDFQKYEIEKSHNGYLLQDNELVYKKNDKLHIATNVIVINPKYADIFRLLINGYNKQNSEMKKSKTLIPAIIITAGLIISAFIYAYAHRYEVRGSTLRIDKWTGTIERLEYKKYIV